MTQNVFLAIQAKVLLSLDDPHFIPVRTDLKKDYLYERAEKCTKYKALKDGVMMYAFSEEDIIEILEEVLTEAKGLHLVKRHPNVIQKTS